ncbi:MAG: PAS domain S-box protein [Spirochaeta sp.]|nr:PAS domain S-box protein [Spirochaeta sp.]
MQTDRTKTVLVVEDAAAATLWAPETLERFGYRITRETATEDAVAALKRVPQPDILLIDMAIAAGTPLFHNVLQTPVVLVSSGDAELPSNFDEISACGFVLRESAPAALDATIRTAIRLHDAATGAGEILETVGDGVWTLDRDGYITNVNSAYCQMSGYTCEELVGGPVHELDADESVADTRARLERIRATGSEMFQTRHRRKDGTFFDAQITASCHAHGDGHIICLCRDVTDREVEHAALLESEAKFRLFVELVPTALVFSDEAGHVVYLSRNFEKLFGYTIREMPTVEEWWRLAYRDTEVRERVRQVWSDAVYRSRKHGEPVSPMIQEVTCADGTLRDIEFRFATTGVLNAITLTDVTDRVAAEAAVQGLVAEKELLLKEVHHRIKNNMNTMASLLSLQAFSASGPEVVEALHDAASRMESMRVLYDKLYRSETIEAVSVREYVNDLVSHAISLFPGDIDVTSTTEVADVQLSPDLLAPLGIILNEVITNAMKHAFADRRQGQLALTMEARRDELVFSVSDDGPGIPGLGPDPVRLDAQAGGIGDRTGGLGMTVIASLTEQVKGSTSVWCQNGLNVQTRIPREVSTSVLQNPG